MHFIKRSEVVIMGRKVHMTGRVNTGGKVEVVTGNGTTEWILHCDKPVQRIQSIGQFSGGFDYSLTFFDGTSDLVVGGVIEVPE
ncbi:hypothetical protein ACIP5Y_21825 [Nocardia sp. NPDC088792]|uniref:hypothetical protein n=1 Tax=Nocardia sp. NPDC088792 TaxID=3364332 RepID=UPI0037FE7D8B